MQPSASPTRPLRLIALFATIAALYFARELFRPAALAVLFTFLLLPLVRRLRDLGVNRTVAVVLTVVAAGGVTLGVGLLVGKQVVDLSLRLPDYRENLRAKARALRQSGEGAVGRLAGTIRELEQELSTTNPATDAVAQGAQGAQPSTPVKVQVISDGPEVTEVATSLLGPLLFPIAEGAIVVLLLIFFLHNSDDLRDRLVSLSGMRQISLTASAMNEIAQRVGQYMRAQLRINLCYGVMLGIGLWFIGLPNALLWGVMGFLLRFVPYVGPWMAAVLPTLLSIAAFPGWSRVFAVGGLFVVVELVTNLVLEPWLYGASAGMSTIGVVVASVFWAWLWGPVGLLVAVPITICLVVAGKHLPQLAMLHQLIGSDADVPAVARMYQHLLLGDADSADDVLAQAVKTRPLPEVCDSLLLPALSELKRDHAEGVIDARQVTQALEAMDLTVPAPPSRESSPGLKVVCVGGQNEIDQCAARLFAAACGSRGVSAEALPGGVLANEAAELAHRSGASHVLIIQVRPVSHAHSKRLIMALSSRLESAQVIDLSAATAEPMESGEADSPAPHRREFSFARVIAELAEKASVARQPSVTSN
jgi:predicted PurR-regulated permease PerM